MSPASPRSPAKKSAAAPGAKKTTAPSHPRYVALLRAVNVGGHVIKMDELRRVFESLAFANVQTFIASGNVIFETALKKPAEIERTIEAGLQKAFKYPIPTFVRSTAEMVAAAENVPFAAGELPGCGLYVTFYRQPLSGSETSKVEAMKSKDDDFAVVGREVYWLRRRMAERLGEPFPALGKAVAVPGTMRSITTVRKIAGKYCGMAP